MNFDADRLSRLSGLGPVENTGVITESVNELSPVDALSEEDENVNETCCGCGNKQSHSHDLDEDVTIFEVVDDLDEDLAEESVQELDEEPAPLTMEALRATVLELRDEILAEQAEAQQALTEAPARTAIRREIQALLAEMPADAATNWIYGKKGKPSSAHNKSRATALAGVGFANSKH